MNKTEILKEKRDIVQSDTYKKLRDYQIEIILGLANSQIEPIELKGMLKLICKTDNWEDEYIKSLNKKTI